MTRAVQNWNIYTQVCAVEPECQMQIFGRESVDPPLGELAEPITLRDKLACVWKQLLAAPSQISVAVDLRSMTKIIMPITPGGGNEVGRERRDAHGAPLHRRS
jgi:hypothetical protein